MTTVVTIDTHAAVKKLIGSKFTEEQAEAIVSVLTNVSDTVATKHDLELLRRDIAIQIWSSVAVIVAVLSAFKYF